MPLQQSVNGYDPILLEMCHQIKRSIIPFLPVDLGEVLDGVLTDLEARLLQTGGHVERDNLPVVDADPTQMRQLFQNLIGNALKYCGQHAPMVKISARIVERNCEIAFEDNGIGFEERYIEKIFKPFERLHGRAAYEGTGMGLAICKKIVERHGWSIKASSTPGTGSIFSVVLPIIQEGNTE